LNLNVSQFNAKAFANRRRFIYFLGPTIYREKEISMAAEEIAGINPKVDEQSEQLEFWLELHDTPHVCDYPLTPQSRFVIGNDDPVDKEIRFAVNKYLSRKKFRPQKPPALSDLSVFVCSPTPILDKTDLGNFFEQSLRGYIQSSTWPNRGLQDSEAEAIGYVVQLQFETEARAEIANKANQELVQNYWYLKGGTSHMESFPDLHAISPNNR
jgi:hypothetical protein